MTPDYCEVNITAFAASRRNTEQATTVYGIGLKLPKCEFFQEWIEYLGHMVTTECQRPAQKKRWWSWKRQQYRCHRVVNRFFYYYIVLFMKNKYTIPCHTMPCHAIPYHTNSFLCLLKHHMKFLPDLSALLGPLKALTHSCEEWTRDTTCEPTFKNSKIYNRQGTMPLWPQQATEACMRCFIVWTWSGDLPCFTRWCGQTDNGRLIYCDLGRT